MLLISLLAISSVSASDVDNDILLNEDLVNSIDSDLISPTDLQSDENSEGEANCDDVILNSVSSDEEDANCDDVILNSVSSDEEDILKYPGNDFYVQVNDVSYRSESILSITIGQHEVKDKIKIYVDQESNPRFTFTFPSSFEDDYLDVSPNDLNLDFGVHNIRVYYYTNNVDYLLRNSEIDYHCLKMYFEGGNDIFEDVELTTMLWDVNKNEGTLTYSLNNNSIATKNFNIDYNYFTIPSSYFNIGENIISVKYESPNYPTDEISTKIYIPPRIYDLPSFISSVESINVVVEFPSKYLGTVNVYDSYYDYDGEYHYDLVGSANILNGVANIQLSNFDKIGASRLIVESITNFGINDTEFEFRVIRNDPNVLVEVTPLTILVGENVFITLNAPYSKTLYVTVDGREEKMYNMSSYIKVLSDLSVGKHTVSIKFYGNYSNSFIITVNAIKTSITSSNTNAVYDTTKSVSATLIDNLGNPIVGKTVTLVINKKTYTAKTNAYGKATFKISAKLLPKAYTATIKFAGDKTYAQFTKSIKVTIKKATPKLTAKAKTFRVKVKTKKYTITLKNNNGKVMKNTKVTLTVNKKTFSAKTNSKGVATFKITNLKKKGKFTAVVKYAGSKYYNKVTKKPRITIKA